MAKISKERKQELVRVKLASILSQATSDPKFASVTIASLKLSPDGSKATVFFSNFGSSLDPGVVEAALNRSAGFFSSKMGQSLQTRNTPKLHFIYDKGFDHTDKINQLLQENPPLPESEDSES